MLKEYNKRFNRIFRTIDLFIILLSFYAAYYLRFGKPPFFSVLPIQYQVFFLAYLIPWFYLSYRFDLYRGRRTWNFWKEAWDVAKTVLICFTVAEVVGFFLRDLPLSRIFLAYLLVIQASALIIFRLSLRKFLRYIRKQGYNFRNVLVVGWNDRSAKFLKWVKESPEFGLHLLGIIDAPNGSHPQTLNPTPLGGLKDLEPILRNQVVDEVFVFLPIKSFYSEIEEVLNICERVGIETKIPTDPFNRHFSRAKISIYGDLPVINFYSSPKMNVQLIIKRLLDIIISAVILILFFPVLLVVALLIKITSEGPIFFKQTRVGYNGRIFTCIKFRTMVKGADEFKKDLLHLNEMDGPVFKIRKDPRATKVGRILRKISIDEIPQFINVLMGDMSMVGPRPPVPEEVTQYDLNYRKRLSMKPGITCFWQINGRNKISFEKWMELDKQYIDRWSLWLDIRIMAKTIPAVLKRSGAS